MGIKIISMNVDGGNDGVGSAARRKTAIHDIVMNNQPDIIFFQEFDWANINWAENALPANYTHIRHQDTCIVLNSRRISNIRDIPQIVLERLDPEEHPNKIEQRRYLIRLLTVDKDFDISCMSWHGPYTGLTDDEKVLFFNNHLMKFIRNIQKKYRLPMIIAGDFNVNRDNISDHVAHPFTLIHYDASQRRQDSGVIDFIITTDSLESSDESWINLNNTTAENPEVVLDHDPIKASLIERYDRILLEVVEDIHTLFNEAG